MSAGAPNFLVTLPHSGETIPPGCDWLSQLPKEVLLRDVDRFVDALYLPVIEQFNLPYVKTQWHRYAADLNRTPEDIDQDSVIGASLPPGKMPRGFHWVITTFNERLMPAPISKEQHQELVNLVYKPFHQAVQAEVAKFKSKNFKHWYHLDLHSMPSVGTSEHRDPGEKRADIVISDSLGRSASPDFVDLVITSYVRSGFKVGYNWPYVGGRITEQYGHPQKGHHTVQVELNRALYMNEETKDQASDFLVTQKKLTKAIEFVNLGLAKLES